jgi:diguanylate cyclase (GGDEF)-like protein
MAPETGGMAASEIDALRAELAALRHEFDDLRLHLPDAFVEGDLASERVTFMNRVACQVFGCTHEEALTLHARDLFAEGEYERASAQMKERLTSGYAAGGAAYSRSGRQDLREFRMRRRDGSSFPAETQSSLILDLAGRARGVRTLVRDISARKELEAPSAHWVCLLFDLTDFKSINDTYGHDEGDRVLQAFAHFLARHHRSEDILVRLGGDEFALFIRAESEGEGQAICGRVVEAAGKDSPAAFSLGTAFRRDAEGVSSLLSRADQVLYASKGRSLRSTRRGAEPGSLGEEQGSG